MKISRLRYIFTLVNEGIGAYELVPRHKRYLKLSQSLKVMSNYMSGHQIISFYRDRSVIYKQIKVFTGFFIAFLVFMGYILSGSWFFALSITLILLVFYGVITIFVKAERNYCDLWDDRELFSNFIKLNQSAVFDPESFDVIVKAEDESAMADEKLSFEENMKLLIARRNNFNQVPIDFVVVYFDFFRRNSKCKIKELKVVNLTDEQYIRFIKELIVERNEIYLDFILPKGVKMEFIRAVFHKFYTYNLNFAENFEVSHDEIATNNYIRLMSRTFKKFKNDKGINFKCRNYNLYSGLLDNYIELNGIEY